MKKWMKLLAVLFSALLLSGLAACGKGGEEKKPGESAGAGENETEETGSNYGIVPDCDLAVGYARVNITPDAPVPLSGYGNSDKRMSTGYIDYLMASVIAVSDKEGTTVMLCTVDTVIPNVEIFRDDICLVMAEAAGIPKGNVYVTATHSHSSTDLGYVKSMYDVERAFNTMKQLMVDAAQEAMQDRSPAEAYWTEADLTGYNFIRHYLLQNGEYVGDNFGDDNGEYVGHSTEENPWMQILEFKREGKKSVLVTNWRAHATITGGFTVYNISADFPGAMRNYIEKNRDCYCNYFQGDAGNSNPRSRIAAENCTDDVKKYGEQIGERIIKAVKENEVKLAYAPIKIVYEEFEGPVNHEGEELLAIAQEISAYWAESNDRLGAVEMGRPYGITSPYHANAIVSHAGMAMTRKMDMTVLQICEVGIVRAGYEMFVENGNFIRENSPYKYTMVMGYSDSHNSYIPSQAAYDYGCYESYIGYYAAGTGEVAASKFVELLEELKKK